MSRRKAQSTAKRINKQQRDEQRAVKNSKLFRELIKWCIPPGELFHKSEFHGNVKWLAEEVMTQALIWSWQEAKNVTDAFDQTREICDDLKLGRTIVTYTAFMNALTRHRELFHDRLRDQFQMLAENVGGERFRTRGWAHVVRSVVPGRTATGRSRQRLRHRVLGFVRHLFHRRVVHASGPLPPAEGVSATGL